MPNSPERQERINKSKRLKMLDPAYLQKKREEYALGYQHALNGISKQMKTAEYSNGYRNGISKAVQEEMKHGYRKSV